MAQTLEQKRAQFAWECASNAKENLVKYSDYVNATKGLPALIMNSGLMQALAFIHEKSGKKDGERYQLLEKHLCGWLTKKYNIPEGFSHFMQALMTTETRQFQSITTEAFAWLKWLRQIAPAVQKGE
jgi:CRISPR-associated protein Cmr5